MKTLLAPTEEFIRQSARTTLEAQAQPGSNVDLTSANAAGFAVDDYIGLGTPGTETAELAKITAISGNTITVDTLLHIHQIAEPLVKYRYNQRKFYGSLTATGTFTELAAGSPAAIRIDDPQGTPCEYTGAEGYLYFKATYYNSTTTDETDIADSEATQGDQAGRYCTLDEIRKQAGLTDNSFIADDLLERKRTEAESEVNSYLYQRYILPLAEVPALIRNCTILLAAGFIAYQEYGADSDGVKWLGEARGTLKKVQDGKIRLIGSDYAELALKSTTAGIQSHPSDAADPDPHFSMDDEF